MRSNLQAIIKKYGLCNKSSKSLKLTTHELEILLEALLDYIFLTVMSRLQDRDDAQDVASEVIVKVYKAFKKDKKLCFRTEPEFFAWLNKIIFNTLYDFLRKQKLKNRINPFSWFRKEENKNEGDRLTTEELIESKSDLSLEASVDVERMLAKLNDNDRALLVLRYYYGYSVKEIAAMVGKKPDTLRKYMYRLLKRLRLSMSQ